MKESLVLMVNLTPVLTEVARHLVLSGISLFLVDTHADLKVSLDDTQADFLLVPGDVGKIRGEVVREKLLEMNPFVTIRFTSNLAGKDLDELAATDHPESFSAVVSGFTDF